MVAAGVSIGGNESGSSSVVVDTLYLDDIGPVGAAKQPAYYLQTAQQCSRGGGYRMYFFRS